MRITNTMITTKTETNINRNKTSVDKYNNQMTSQKKITKASEDPVIAIRSLRLSTSLSHIEQYSSNISDADAWLTATETALTNMKTLLRDIRTQCVNGSTDTNKSDDRQTILNNLKALAEQVYSEGNADYAGRTIFTGYRTNDNLTFDEDLSADDVKYEIHQGFTYQDIEPHRYYSGVVEVPADDTGSCDTQIYEDDYQRIRFAYSLDEPTDTITSIGIKLTDETGASTAYDLPMDMASGTATVGSYTVKVYDSEADWMEACRLRTVSVDNPNGISEKTVGANELIIIKNTGEIVMSDATANDFINKKAEFSTSYVKHGFEAGELRPEYYFDCTKTEASGVITKYTKQNQEINYIISNATNLTVNTQAEDVFSHDIGRDVKELINVVQAALDAQDKVTKITNMMAQEQYSSDESQEVLQGYLDAANKELSYAEDNMQKTYGQYITNFDNYLEKVNIAITHVGSTQTRLTMTSTRVENQETTVTELKSSNEDRDLSDVVIDFYAAYYAYQASLTAAGKLNQHTLLDYI